MVWFALWGTLVVESLHCVTVPSEHVTFSGEVRPGLGRNMTQGVVGNTRAFADKKKGGKLWRRLWCGKKLVRQRARKHIPGKDRRGHKSQMNDDDVNAILSCITQESSIEKCTCPDLSREAQ
uniref:Uncharacterized protein n=1 Tax=Arundo donax TaxID=35708 RepID=A0A0A9GIF8_ARUDO